MIRAVFYDEDGRVTGRTEEALDEREYIPPAPRAAGTVQITTEWKGTRRRPINLAHLRAKEEMSW